jgi:NADPH:quinone reductase-like Zn-dependent oxidoreductase
VSIFALQFAKLAGLQVAVTSSSQAKLERASQLGADFTVNYGENPEWHKAILQWSGGEGVDKVIEVGGAGTLPLSLRCLRPGGEIAMIGVLSGHQQPVDVRPILMQELSIQGVLVGHRDHFESMNRAILGHGLRPQVDRLFPFSEAPEAFTHLQAGHHFGKVCIQVS